MCFGARFFLCLLAFAPLAQAHDVFEITTSGRLNPARMTLAVRIVNNIAGGLLGKDEPPVLEEANFEQFREQFLGIGKTLYSVTDGELPLQPTKIVVELKEDSQVEFVLFYPAVTVGPLHFRANFLERIGPEVNGSFVLLGETGDPLISKLLSARDPSVTVPLYGKTAPSPSPLATGSAVDPPAATASAAAPAPAIRPSFGEFLKLGIEHILTGYDHLLFLFGLLVATRRVRSMLVIITCFTLAHSLTLALAALNVFSIHPRIVEPLIAATIVFVGAENLIFGEGAKGRAWLAFGFGLIHGFGFASVLRETGLGTHGAGLLIPLFSFNLGVECGQLAVAAVVIPILWQLRKLPAFARYGMPAASGVVVLLGSYWFVQRIF